MSKYCCTIKNECECRERCGRAASCPKQCAGICISPRNDCGWQKLRHRKCVDKVVLDQQPDIVPNIRPVDQAIRTVVEKYCDFGTDRWVICGDLCKTYNTYWTTPISPEYFGRQFAAIYPDIKKRRRRINGELHYVYEGLAIKQAVKQNL